VRRADTVQLRAGEVVRKARAVWKFGTTQAKRSPRNQWFADLYGSFSVKWFFGLCRFLVWSGKAVPRPIACDQVRGARGKVSRDRNASAA
jgi:hypothetical protein